MSSVVISISTHVVLLMSLCSREILLRIPLNGVALFWFVPAAISVNRYRTRTDEPFRLSKEALHGTLIGFININAMCVAMYLSSKCCYHIVASVVIAALIGMTLWMVVHLLIERAYRS